MTDEIQGDSSLADALNTLAQSKGDSVVTEDGGEIRVLELTPDLMASLMQSLVPKPNELILATLAKFAEIDPANDDKFGLLAVEIAGTDDFGIPLAIFEIRDHFGQITDFVGDDPTDEEIATESKTMGAYIVAFLAGIEFAKKNGATPVVSATV